jgi:hypothetical protein
VPRSPRSCLTSKANRRGDGWVALCLTALTFASGACSDKAQTGGAHGSGGGPGQGGSVVITGTGGFGGAARGGQSGGAGAAGQGGIVASAGRGGAGGAGGQILRSCKGTGVSQPSPNACRSMNECSGPGPFVCCTASPCWPESISCPLPPFNCPPFACTTSQDCNPGGTCVSTIGGCPRCEARTCQYPPPPCTQSPDSCGSDARCQTDGTCRPLLCTDGYTCISPHHRCNPAGGRSDAHGCEYVPCDDGWTCDQNTRCTNPADAASHGCTAVPCKQDLDCDCGYCVNGACSAVLGYCSSPPA